MSPKKNWLLKAALIFVGFQLGAAQVHAGKFDVMLGYFMMTARTTQGTGGLNGIGVYSLGYRHPVLSKLEVGIGYSVLMSRGIGGDLSFGFDFSASYFPITQAGPVEANSPDTTVVIEELWRPYVSVSFHQRQFQSTQTGYAGFGLAAGTEYHLYGPVNLKGEGRLILLGARSASITQIDLLIGASLHF